MLRGKFSIMKSRRLLQKMARSDEFLVLIPDGKGNVEIISPREVDREEVASMLEHAAVITREAA
jgi:hypothetical protein